MLSTIIIILSVLLVYGAVMWVKPSARDKRLAALRAQAMADGFRVRSCLIQDLSIEGRLQNKTRAVFSYRSYQKGTLEHSLQILRTTGESGIYLPQSWTWGTSRRLNEADSLKLSQQLLQLPNSIIGLELAPEYIGLIWDERNSDEYPIVKRFLQVGIPYQASIIYR